MRQTLRSHILNVASELFNDNGIQATGVDKIVAEANVAKMTLYKHFPSKDDLVIAYLEKRSEEWRLSLEQTVNENGKTPIDKLLAIFDFWIIGLKAPILMVVLLLIRLRNLVELPILFMNNRWNIKILLYNI